MATDTRVYLVDSRLPTPDAWQAALDRNQTGLQIDRDVDLRTHTGFISATWRGAGTGFEWYYAPASDYPDEIPPGVESNRHHAALTTHDLRELACAQFAAATLAELTGGRVWSEERVELIDGTTAMGDARRVAEQCAAALTAEGSASPPPPSGTQAGDDEYRPDERGRGGGLGVGKVLLIALVIAVAVGGFFWANQKAASARPVWLVNGTIEPYAVEINGQRHEVPYGKPTKIKLPLGMHTVRILKPPRPDDVSDEAAAAREAFRTQHLPASAGQTFTLDATLGLAVLDGQTHVLNPDGAAILLVSDVVYGNKTGGPDELQPLALHHVLDDIDDAFVDSPNSVETSSTSSGVIRRRVDPWLYEERMSMPGFAGEPLSESDQEKQILARLSMDPNSLFWQQEARKVLGDEAADRLSLMEATPEPMAPSTPDPPTIEMPRSPADSFVGAAGSKPTEAVRTPGIWAGIGDDLFTVGLTESIGSSSGSPKVSQLLDAIEPLAEAQGSGAAEQIVWLLRDQVSPKPARFEKLETLGVPARIRVGLMLVMARTERDAEAQRLRDAARELAADLDDLPVEWAEAMGALGSGALGSELQ